MLAAVGRGRLKQDENPAVAPTCVVFIHRCRLDKHVADSQAEEGAFQSMERRMRKREVVINIETAFESDADTSFFDLLLFLPVLGHISP